MSKIVFSLLKSEVSTSYAVTSPEGFDYIATYTHKIEYPVIVHERAIELYYADTLGRVNPPYFDDQVAVMSELAQYVDQNRWNTLMDKRYEETPD